MATVRLRAHAKVNLYLRVLGRRADGYHDVETVLHGIDLADYLEFRSTAGDTFTLDITAASDLAGPLPPGDQNIVRHAVELLEKSLARSVAAEGRLGKRIPMGAGLGGGSSDAAAALLGLIRLHELDLDQDRMVEIATQLGADVPFFLNGGTAVASGIGENIRPLADPPRLWFVLGISRHPLLTKDVYAAWEERHVGDELSVDRMIDSLSSGDPNAIAEAMGNDLQASAIGLRPELSDGLDALAAAGALRAIVSGSGPTLLALCEGPVHARSLAASVRDRFDHTQVTCSQPRTIEFLD